jgi:hypothetical protein
MASAISPTAWFQSGRYWLSSIRSNCSQELLSERMRCVTLAALSSGIMLLTSVDQGFQEGHRDE